jgi:UDP-GlcNAc3NAcA epimerase
MLKIATIIGARPQFIKAATVSRAVSRHNQTRGEGLGIKEVIIHTGQHYDENMSQVFFDELHIPKPDYHLGIGSGAHGSQTGRMLAAIEDVLVKERPDLVLIYGDTNSTLAGALAAVKLHIPSAHVEAGLRSFNRRMPEEINRVLADEISNILFCPTETSIHNLLKEGIGRASSEMEMTLDLDRQMAFHVGDVMYDSILFHRHLAIRESDALKRLGLMDGAEKNLADGKQVRPYGLVTIHRPENTDEPKNLESIFEALSGIATAHMRIIIPLHPRTRKNISEFGLDREFSFLRGRSTHMDNSITIVDPLSYLDMVQMEAFSKVIMTDSGGVQKEAYFLGVPCITLRNETEWVETVDTKWNVLTGPSSKKILDAFSRVLDRDETSPPFGSPEEETDPLHGQRKSYGDGRAAEKIVGIISRIRSGPSVAT